MTANDIEGFLKVCVCEREREREGEGAGFLPDRHRLAGKEHQLKVKATKSKATLFMSQINLVLRPFAFTLLQLQLNLNNKCSY